MEVKEDVLKDDEKKPVSNKPGRMGEWAKPRASEEDERTSTKHLSVGVGGCG
jgi:hypothetical protein